MKRFSTGLLLAGAMAGMISCSSEEGFRTDGPDGKIVLNLSSDARVIMNTRADDTKVSVVPEPSQFGISFEKQDGSFSKNWVNVDAFNREGVFPIGTYTLSATYGDMEQEGFELPCFSASQSVTVEAGTESHVQLTATLSNAMVSVRYSDDFKSRFAAYSSALKAESSADWVVFAQNEDRPAYMKPGKLDLRITLTNGQGDKVEVAPYSFTAAPRHHYIVTLGVNDQNGTENARLDVQITEEVESDFVDIALGDELFTAPAPALKVYDFPADMSYNEFESFEVPGDPRIDVLAYGGLRKVNINVASSTALAFGNSVQLVGADPIVQNQVASTGLEVQGFYRNPDKAGVIKFKDFLAKLPEGTYKFTVDVEDARTLVCENPVEFNVTIKQVNIKLSVASHPEYMGKEMTVAVTTNQPNVKENIRFEVTNDKGAWVEAKILDTPSSMRTRADGEYVYNYRLSIPAVEHYDIKVRAFYGVDTAPKAEIKDEDVIFPEYSVEVDAYANKVLFKVSAADPAKFDIVKKNFKVALNGSEKDLAVYNDAEGIFEYSGLQAATAYDSFESFLSYMDNPKQPISAFTTEAMTDVPNGDFSLSTETINFKNVNVGGQWSRTLIATHQTTTSIVRSTPNDWATVNELTCYKGASNKNTWFIVPSTYENNGAVILQTVGYSHNGTDPAKTSQSGAGVENYYCKNSPSDSQLAKAAGELFLGAYSYDGTVHRTDGIAWNTRPEALSFIYSYESYNGEKGEAYVNVYDASGI
ncbi:MAG: DUF4493 domain-containing protein, partial [Muribaculaceae bacterium]|nr:DUF4493 domain-containing protein [Muribaculaceae bacterium]